MLTPREFEQLVTAIDCMHTIVVNRDDHISRHNVKILISRFAEEGSSCFIQDVEVLPEEKK